THTSLTNTTFPQHIPPPPTHTLFPYTTLFRSHRIKEYTKVRVWSAGAESFLIAQEAVALTHEEHSAAIFEVGVIYKQVYQVEDRSEEHTSELQSPYDLVCRLLLEKKNAQLISG